MSGPPRSVVPLMSSEDQERAECKKRPDVSFFPELAERANSVAVKQYRLDVARAKAVCRSCPVRDACLDTALAMKGHDDAGILGGTTARERRRLRKERR